jgi:preprotein translocase subunit SecE
MAAEAKVGNNKNNSIVNYFKGVRSEFRKITWASREEVLKTTTIVLTIVLIVAMIIWAFDSAFGFILKSILNNIS